MLKADIHRKLTEESEIKERLEDALTSNVFGSLLYADAQDILLDWLGGAENLGHERLRKRLPGGEHGIELTFWPKMEMPSGSRERGREPDVLVTLRDAKGPTFAICVEAKLDSPLSPQESEPTIYEGENPKRIKHDQLADQYVGLENDKLSFTDHNNDNLRPRLPAKAAGARVVVFLTGHDQFPRRLLEASVRSVKEFPQSPATCDADIYWLGWHSLSHLLQRRVRVRGAPVAPGQELLLDDLLRVLHNKGLHLDPFDGFPLGEGPTTDHGSPWLAELVGVPDAAPRRRGDL